MATDEQKKIAQTTKQSYLKDWKTGRPYTDASYAVDALKGSVADSMRKQGEEASSKVRRKAATKRGSK